MFKDNVVHAWVKLATINFRIVWAKYPRNPRDDVFTAVKRLGQFSVLFREMLFSVK